MKKIDLAVALAKILEGVDTSTINSKYDLERVICSKADSKDEVDVEVFNIGVSVLCDIAFD